jgi:hypothetical protein
MSAVATVRRKLLRLREYGNVRGVIFFAQRRVLDSGARRRLASFVARFLPRTAESGAVRTESSVALERDGFAMIEGVVTPQMVEDMCLHLGKQLVYAPYIDDSPRVPMDGADVLDTHILTVVDEGVMSCPHLLDIANHPSIIGAVESTFGCKPTIGYISAWWSVPTADGVARHAENFHRDFDDIAFIKLFIYLSDVELENGPHDFILGSHTDPALRPIRRYSDAEVFASFSGNRLVRFTGKSGTVFLENTTGLHRGLPVQAGKRLMLQIVYSMLPMAYGPAKPYPRDVFQPASAPIDPYTNRIYVARD